MLEFLLRIWALTRPYRSRLLLGVMVGVLGGLVEPLMIASIGFVYGLIFPSVETSTSLLTEKSFKEHGDKIDASEKQSIEDAITKAKKATPTGTSLLRLSSATPSSRAGMCRSPASARSRMSKP